MSVVNQAGFLGFLGTKRDFWDFWGHPLEYWFKHQALPSQDY
jgi:hypothetical protein